MLEKPNLSDEKLIQCVQDDYGLRSVLVAFLPIGADPNTAVYRVVAADNTPYFLKLRSGDFVETSVAVPRFLSDQGVTPIIPPIETRAGQLWTRLDAFAVILYPYVEGQNGFEADLSDRHRVELGVTLKRIHTADVPRALKLRIPRETYAPVWRDAVRSFLDRIEDSHFDDPIAAELAAILRTRHDEISYIVERAEHLGESLRSRSPEFVLCHGDIHAWNVLIGADDALYVVDWDTLIFAPKERDLMFVGGGVDRTWRSEREQALFYQGYGETEIDLRALAYYRYERIVEDIAVECEQILSTTDGGADREQALRFLASQFLPNGVVEIAHETDRQLRAR